MSGRPGPFAIRVAQAMQRKGLTLRSFCRRALLDPSFVSKVLSGKRNPPCDEAVLRRMADVLELNACELTVAAGLVPAQWHALWEDHELFSAVDSMATRTAAWPARKIPPRPAPACGAAEVPPRPHLSEELL